MVNQASLVDADKALEENLWNSEQFNAVLGQFTDQVINHFCQPIIFCSFGVKAICLYRSFVLRTN